MVTRSTSTITGTGGVDTTDFKKFAKALRKGAPQLALEMKNDIRAIGEVVAADARERASFSKRIPASVKVRVASTTVSVVAGGKNAPDAEVFENKGKEGNFRHPLFGDKTHWYTQKAHPFLRPAVVAGGPAAGKAIVATLNEIITQVVVETEI
jgi:hypothetical protein